MPSTHPSDSAHALHTAGIRRRATSKALRADDRHLAHRVLRMLRDRLTVDAAAQSAARLPDLVQGPCRDGRGPCRDGRGPGVVPLEYDREGHIDRFVQGAEVTAEEALRIAPAVGVVVREHGEHVSPGQLEAALNELPHDTRALLLQPTA
ncbi:DUF2267 domain-containing protein [Streptomyces sp. NEAU-W12]|uniref:DUF2267 domain-containing protein n=1 Tax=Streptomyces sp. NEAU-W12 TaxID=2994668 RepID=UPI00224AEB12|nr:DUF2267 domain-containing protein [Streptomyces sp. NEAU-W12]MCX2925585.1 DUF2267 domain-containing protein [Streptomyces sp. NEAU-W12]